MKKWFLGIFVMFFAFGFSVAFAQDAIQPGDFAAQVLNAVKSLGGLPWVGKVAVIVTLIIASMKVSVLDDMVWNKLGKFKVWAAPVLGMIIGILSPILPGGSGHVTLASIFAYVSAGAGAILLHELLDSVKAVPGIGGFWVSVIGVVEGALGGNPASPEDKAVVAK